MNYEGIEIKKEISIIFMGTPDFSVPILESLIEKYNVRAVVTQPDRLIDKKGNLIAPPVKRVANEHTILTLQPPKIKNSIEEIRSLNPDIIITCAYGQILPPELLAIPRLGCINVHASLLPALRGGAPIHRAILEGYKKTGVTIMYMSRGMDEGDIISQREIEILDTDTAESLHDKLSILGRDLLLDTLPSILDGTNKRTPQDSSKATYAFTIKREDERIKFSRTKKEIYNQVRGLNSWPVAYCLFEGKILKVWECYISDNMYPEAFDGQITNIYDDGIGVKVSNGEIVLTTVQLEGKRKMSAIDFSRGHANNGLLVGKMLD